MIITNPPVHISKSDYERAISIYANKISKCKDVVSLYTMGSVKAPGLSDLDPIVIVKDNYDPEESELLSTKEINEKIFIHGPVVIPVKLASKIPFLIYATNFVKFFGENCLSEINDLPLEKKNNLMRCYLVDFTESRFLQFAEVNTEKKIDQRKWMTRIWSLTHSYNILKNLKVSMPRECHNIIENIKVLRNTWVRKQVIDNNMFMKVYNQSYKINSLFFINGLNCVVKHQSQHINKKMLFSNNKVIYFSDFIDSPRYIFKRVKICKRYIINCYICQQLPKYAIYLNGYQKKPDNYYGNVSLMQVMGERARVVTEHWTWLRKHSPNANSMTGYLGYPSWHTSISAPIILKLLLNRIYLKAFATFNIN